MFYPFNPIPMSNYTLLFITILFLAYGQLPAQITRGHQPAGNTLDQVIRHYDPDNQWAHFSGEMHLLTIHPSDGSSEEDLLLDNQRSLYQSVLYDGDQQIVKGIDQGKVFHNVNGQTDLSAEIIEKYNLTNDEVRWMSEHHRTHFGLPMFLKEKAITPSSIEKVTFAGKECLQLRFDPPGEEDSEIYFQNAISIYINPSSFMMEGMLYEGSIGKDNQGAYALFNQTIEVGGVLIPKVKAYYHRSDDSYWFTDIFQPTPRINHLASEAEKEAIRKVLDEETQFFYSRDYTKWASCWSHQPDVYFAFSSKNDYVMRKGWEEVDDHIKNYMRNNPDPHSPPIERSNFVFHLQGNLAWVYFDNREGDIYGRQQRVLRKENGVWKLINVTAFDESSYQE